MLLKAGDNSEPLRSDNCFWQDNQPKVEAEGSEPFSYQWSKDDVAIEGQRLLHLSKNQLFLRTAAFTPFGFPMPLGRSKARRLLSRLREQACTLQTIYSRTRLS